MLTQKFKDFIFENRSFMRLLLCYGIALSLVNWILPLEWEKNWFFFYKYLYQYGITPYIDYREGYPPLGFLIYMPFTYLSNWDVYLFAFYFRMVNLVFLILSCLLIYLIVFQLRGRKAALIASTIYAVCPTVVLGGKISNDSFMLFLSLLGLYFLLKGKPSFSGMVLGLATMVKIFPALFVIIGLKWFGENRDKFRLFLAFMLTVYFISLPFLVMDPFMYLSTFIHHGSRGPWETIWALIDGWYSHGGFIHPDFDQFFYHFQLLKIYSPSPLDHAFYDWKYPLIPTFLIVCQVAVAIAFFLFGKCENKSVLIKKVTLILLLYVLFFKGYSPQFTVFTLPFLLLSLKGAWLGAAIFLEAATEIQLLAWRYELPFSHDYHLPLLIFAVLLRTLIFVVVIGLLVIQLKRRKGYE